ncbi:MAG: TetR/AcrR family transcriptional regulator [Asticcacaulis sp.]
MDDLTAFEGIEAGSCGGQGLTIDACVTARRRGRPRAFDPDVVLEQVLEMFWMRGFAATSLDDIAAETGVSRPSLASTFGDKEALYLKAMQRYRDGINDKLDRVLTCNGEGDTLLGIVRRYFDIMLDSYTGQSDDCLGCAFTCTALNEAPRHESIRSVLQNTIEEFDLRFEAFFKEAQAMGHIGPDKAPQVMSQMVTGLTSSLAVRARAGASREDLQKIVIANTAFLFA